MNNLGFSSFDTMFNLASSIITIGFIFVFGMIILTMVRSAKQYHKNNLSPVLTVDAFVAVKRTDVTEHTHFTGENNSVSQMSSSTRYYVTFQVESGDRMEFSVSGSEYGLLAEGDKGKLTFQGTGYLGFNRM